MNTKFKILWFEDEVAWYIMERIRINEILKKNCLVLEDTRKDGEDFNISEIMGNEYDLILMDYQLASEKTGDEIVKAIRENNILTDILFYSSQEDKLTSSLIKEQCIIEGIYIAKRDYALFTEKVEKLIDKIIRRSEDIINLRGFVLDNCSDFEVRIKEILNICWEKFDDVSKKSLSDKMVKILDDGERWVKKQVQEAKNKENIFKYTNNATYLLRVVDRLEILDLILEILYTEYDLDKEQDTEKFKTYYCNHLNKYRNKLSHVKCTDKSFEIDNKVIAIDRELHRLMRQNISQIDAKIERIERYITQKI